MTAVEPIAAGDLESMSEERFAQLAARARGIADLATREHRTVWDVESAAERAGVSRATVYRDLQRARGEGRTTIRDLAGRTGGFPKGRSRLHPHVEAVVAEALRGHYLSPNKPPLTETVKVIDGACERLGLPGPRYATVRRRLLKMNRAAVLGRRDGKKAREAATARPGSYEIKHPWDCWQIDHTKADVIIVDKESRKPVGRPWLTVIIDVATRMVVGFYVSLEPPSILRAGAALDQAVRPKGPWLKQLGLDYRWPVEGLPKLIHSDRAGEFQSRAFERALANQGVETFLRPAGKAHWGGHIERMIGTMMGRCKMLPGATQRNPKARGDYDASKGAALDIDQLELWFAHQILGEYHNTVHSSLGCTPLEAWERKAAGLHPRRPDDPESFRIDLFPEITRTLTRTGLKAFGEEYASEDTTLAYAEGRTKARLKFDPRNLGCLYLQTAGRWVRVPYRLPNHSGRYPTLWFYNYARRLAKVLGAPLEGIMARAAREKAEELLHGEAHSSRIARLAVERLRQARVATEAPPAQDHDDSWGGAL